MAVGDAYVFPGFLTPVLAQLFFQKPPLLFSNASAEVRGKNTPERKVNRGSNSQPPGHESDTLTTEPPGWGYRGYSQDKSRQMHECMQIQGNAFVATMSSSLQAGLTKTMHISNDGCEFKHNMSRIP